MLKNPLYPCSVALLFHSRRTSFLLVGLLALFVSSCTRPTPAENFVFNRHPIIVIDIDTLRADHLGSYGYFRKTSPNIDALAQESIRFEWAFSQAPNTPPSQTSIFTGLYPSVHGMITKNDRVPEEVTTMAEVLAAQGYRTAGFVDGGYMRSTFGINQGFEVYDDEGGGLKKIGPKAIEWLQQHSEQTFFLLIHTYDTHTPYSPPEPYRSLFLDGIKPTPGFEPDGKTILDIRLSKYTDKPRSLAANDLAYTVALYDAGVRYVDNWIGQFLEEVRRLGLDQKAIIVLISDHGDEFQEHGSVGHEKLYATITHIPLLIRLPGGKEAKVVSNIVETIDLMPTLLDMVGLPTPVGIQGQSTFPLLQGKKVKPQVAFGESPFFGERRFIAQGEYRLLYTLRDKKAELYRFRQDPLEQENLIEKKVSVAGQLSQELKDWMTMVSRLENSEKVSSALDVKTIRQLKTLGYIQ